MMELVRARWTFPTASAYASSAAYGFSADHDQQRVGADGLVRPQRHGRGMDRFSQEGDAGRGPREQQIPQTEAVLEVAQDHAGFVVSTEQAGVPPAVDRRVLAADGAVGEGHALEHAGGDGAFPGPEVVQAARIEVHLPVRQAFRHTRCVQHSPFALDGADRLQAVNHEIAPRDIPARRFDGDRRECVVERHPKLQVDFHPWVPADGGQPSGRAECVPPRVGLDGVPVAVCGRGAFAGGCEVDAGRGAGQQGSSAGPADIEGSPSAVERHPEVAVAHSTLIASCPRATRRGQRERSSRER